MPTKLKSYSQLMGVVRDKAKPKRRASSHRRMYGRAWRKLRESVLARDNNTCVACGTVSGGGLGLHVDHIISRRSGGKDLPSNLQTLCASCHMRKTVRVDGGFGRKRGIYKYSG